GRYTTRLWRSMLSERSRGSDVEVGMRITDVMPALRRAWERSAVVLHHGLAMVGFVAVMVVLVQGGKILPQLVNGGAPAEADDGLVSEAQATQEVPEDSRYRPLAEFLAHRYKVASDATED